MLGIAEIDVCDAFICSKISRKLADCVDFSISSNMGLLELSLIEEDT